MPEKHKNLSLSKRILNPKYIMVYATIGIFIIIYLYGAIRFSDKGFTTLRTFVNMFVDNAYYGISAVGMTMVLITGGIDLSVASIASLTGMFIAYGNANLGIHPAISIAASLVMGIGLGLLQGATIHYLSVPPFITTLTGNFLARGVCSLISRESINIDHPMIDALAKWKIYFMRIGDGEWDRVHLTAPMIFAGVLLIAIIAIILYTLLKGSKRNAVDAEAEKNGAHASSKGKLFTVPCVLSALIAIFVNNAWRIGEKMSECEWVKVKPIAFINFNLILFLVMIIIGAIILQKTRFGRNVYAIGGNEQSAKLMGLPVGRTKVLVYGFNGFCSVLAGVAYALTVKSGWNLALQGGELEVITCAVIGGTLLTGGVGYMVGTLFGVLLKSVIPALITFNGSLLSWWGKIATGGLLLLFICIQRAVVAYSDRKKA